MAVSNIKNPNENVIMNDAQYTPRKIGKFGDHDLYRLSFSGTFPSSFAAKTPVNIAAVTVSMSKIISFSVTAYNTGGSYVGNYNNSDNDKATYYIQSGYLKAVIGNASNFVDRPFVVVIDYI